MIEQLTNEEVLKVLNDMQRILYDYIKSMRYTELGDAVIIQGTCDSIITQ